MEETIQITDEEIGQLILENLAENFATKPYGVIITEIVSKLDDKLSLTNRIILNGLRHTHIFDKLKSLNFIDEDSLGYFITYKGRDIVNDLGYIEFLKRIKEKDENERQKLESELAFVNASNNLIPFQKKYTQISTVLTFISLIIVILSTLQTCAINVTSNQEKGYEDDLLDLKKENIKLNKKIDSLLNTK